jgi:hypothetical protein
MGIEGAEELIRKQTLNDLDIMAEELLQILFRIQNKFGIKEFSLLKFKSIQALVER